MPARTANVALEWTTTLRTGWAASLWWRGRFCELSQSRVANVVARISPNLHRYLYMRDCKKEEDGVADLPEDGQDRDGRALHTPQRKTSLLSDLLSVCSASLYVSVSPLHSIVYMLSHVTRLWTGLRAAYRCSILLWFAGLYSLYAIISRSILLPP